MADTKGLFYAKAKYIDIEVGEELTVVLNEQEAWEHGIKSVDKVALVRGDGSEIVVDVDFTHTLLSPWEIGILDDVVEKYGIVPWEHLGVYFTERSNVSVEAIKKRLQWQKLTDDDMYAIIGDISDNKLTDTMITYYAASNFVMPADDHELYITAKAMAESGEMLKFDWVVADKHCIGGVPWNETTMIIVPTIASLGIKIPKIFSKAITSPAATWECVDVLMNQTFTAQEIQNIVAENNCALIWWGGLSLAPADDKIIKVSYPLSMQSYDKMISSIMAKQYAMWINHCLIDIPMWPTAKVTNQKDADELIRKFTYVGEHLWMKMSVQVTPAEQPIGRGIGAIMQVREVLRVLQQHEMRPADLEEKAMLLAANLVELVGLAKGEQALELCYKQLRSGASWKKMQEIIKAQAHKESVSEYFDGPAYEVNSENLKLGTIVYQAKAKSSGVVQSIDMKHLNVVTRTLGSPLVAQAWVYLDKKVGESFNPSDVLYTLYSTSESKLNLALQMLKEKDMYSI